MKDATQVHTIEIEEAERPEWLAWAEYPFTLRSVDLEGEKVFYTDEGEGPTLLFVHTGLWSFVFRDVVKHLSGRFRCVTLDFPGSGLSPAVDGVGPLIEASSNLLGRFVDALGLSEIILVAHDLGGPVALGLAGRRPELFRGLVLSQTFAWEPDATALRGMLRVMSSGPMRGLNQATNLLARATSTRFGIGRHLSKEGKRAFQGPYRDRRNRRRFHALTGDALRVGSYLAGVEKLAESRLSRLPVLTIFGERNDPFHFQERIRAVFPNTRSVQVPKGYHFPMADDPDLFVESLSSWWAEVVAA